MNRQIALAALLAGTAVLGACKKEPPASLPPDPTPTATSTTSTGGDTGVAALGTQQHFVNAVNGQNVIYFDTDQYNVDSADAAALQSQAAYLNQYPQISITIEGHCDERGTREYNLALGERRALAARNYLVSLGIPADRLRTVSYGKEFPFDPGHTEEAYSKNRRAHFVVTSK